MANNWNLGVVAHLDGTKSKNQLNQDIQALKRVLDNVELKAKLDPNQVKNLENQLNKLQVSLTDITIPQSTLNGLVSQINNALSGIQIPNININPSGVGNAGKQIGEIISKEAANAIGDVTSKVIGQGFTVSPKMSQKVQSELENIVKDWTNGKGKINSITIDTKTDFNEQTLENIEHLKSATVQYSNELGQVITKTLKYKQIGVNTFANGETEAIKGWVESASTYKATLESTSKSTNNFVNQQKKAVTDLTNQVNQIYKSAIDPNASKPIKNSGNLSNLENQYNDIITAIGKMGSASEATFTDERNSVNTLISDLKIVVREYKNAETAATSMRSKDVGTVKAIKTNELDEFIAKIQNSKVPMKEMKSEIASLKTSLSNITDTDSLTAYLNQFDIASSKFKSLKEQFSKGSTVSSVIFNTSELEAQGKVYIQKVRNTIEAIKPELESKLRSAGYTDIEIKGVEKANGQIKSLTATVTDATGAFKQLNFQREKIQGKGKAQFGFVQTDDVKVIGTLSSSVEKVQGNLSTLKSKWEEQSVLVGDFKTKVEQLETSLASVGSKGELNGLKTQIETLKNEASQIAEVNKIQLLSNGGIKNDYATQIAKLEGDFRSLGLAQDTIATKTQNVKNSLATLRAEFAKPVDQQNFQAIQTANDNLQRELIESRNEFEQLRASMKGMATEQQRLSLANTIEAWNQKNTAATKAVREENERYVISLRDLSNQMTRMNFNKINTGFKQNENSMRTLHKLGASLKDQFSQAATSFTQWLSVSSGIMLLVSKTKDAVVELKELDDILTEITKTSDLTEQQLKKLGDSAYDTASKYGRTASDYLTGVQEMYRAGFDNAEQMAELSVLAQSAGDMDSTLSNDYLLATNAAYKYKGSVEELNKVLDSQNYITNNAAISMKDIADATTETASVAAQYGVQIDELSALIATATANTRESGAEVGTALKAILINLQDTTSKPVTETFDALGISMTKVENGAERLKTPIELIHELADAYNSLPEGDIMRANILNEIGQKRHANTLAAVLSDMEAYNKMLELYNSNLADDSAYREAEKSANNFSGSLNKLRNTWTDTVDNILNSDTLTTGVNVLNDLLGMVNKLTDALGGLGTVGLAGGLLAGIKNVG